MTLMKQEGFKFPAIRESDAMFSADSAPVWLDGSACHRCRTPFSVINRKHHCRACGQVFCGACSSKNMSLPKFGIEKEVLVSSCNTIHLFKSILLLFRYAYATVVTINTRSHHLLNQRLKNPTPIYQQNI